MGRNAQPIDILTKTGRKHLTKAEIEGRKKTEIKTGTNILRCPDYVKDDTNAFKKWKEIMRVYKAEDFVSSGDVGSLARYCMTYSEYLGLMEDRKNIKALRANWEKYSDMLPDYFVFQIEQLLKLNPLLQIETAINKKNDLLTKAEDRSFLNILSKVKNVIKKEPEKQDPLASRGFGDV